jgi:hypothetical protein
VMVVEEQTDEEMVLFGRKIEELMMTDQQKLLVGPVGTNLAL